MNHVSERRMHGVRWVLAIAWFILIVSLFFDPVSSQLTEASNLSSPLSIAHQGCVEVQGSCLQESAYAVGAPVFWGLVVPGSIFILLVWGHPLWRRICPLSFVSQIPRALGWERTRKKVNKKSGKIRYELIKVDRNSWLAKNHLKLQFGLFFVGLCSRILFVNSDRLALGVFLLITIVSAVIVGYMFGGKSWCHYFCPMAPVQQIYSEPRALLASTAHEDDQKVTQSMCRTINEKGEELSACVACTTPCLDIDAERSYWNELENPDFQLLYYGYVGLAVGYFTYYYLYAGNWTYYLSGAWAHEENQWGTLFKPGFYIAGQAYSIPKIIAVPLTLGIFTIAVYSLGRWLEKRYKGQLKKRKQPADTAFVRHRLFTLCTFFIFNFFFIFAGSNFVQLLPHPVPEAFPILMATLSSFWLFRTWHRSNVRYQREGNAIRLRKQLKKLNLNVEKVLEGRSLDDLSADEVYVLAKVLPDFSHEKRLETYLEVLRESIEEGYVDGANSLAYFQQMRGELNITDAEHDEILVALGKKYPELFNPSKYRSRENALRLESYRKRLLETILDAWKAHPNQAHVADLMSAFSEDSSNKALETILSELSQDERARVRTLREEYGISSSDEIDALSHTEPEKLWHAIADKIGLLDYLQTGSEEELRNIFNRIDADDSGYLCIDELRTYFKAIDSNFTDAQISAMLQRADTSGDDQVDFEEFQAVFAGVAACSVNYDR